MEIFQDMDWARNCVFCGKVGGQVLPNLSTGMAVQFNGQKHKIRAGAVSAHP
jgi:hypothetical protein